MPKDDELNSFNIPKLGHETLKFKALSQVYKFDPSSLTWARILWIKENLWRSCSFGTIVAPLVSLTSNNPRVTRLASHLLDKKLVTTTKMSCAPFHNSNVHVANKHFAKPHYIYVTIIFPTNIGRISSTKIYLLKKTTLGHNLYANLLN
jgi:hypothetical protein